MEHRCLEFIVADTAYPDRSEDIPAMITFFRARVETRAARLAMACQCSVPCIGQPSVEITHCPTKISLSYLRQ